MQFRLHVLSVAAAAIALSRPLLCSEDPPKPLSADEIIRGFEAALGRHNNKPDDLARTLYSDNYSLREKNRELTGEIEGLKKKVPEDGSVVLAGDDAKAVTEYLKTHKLSDLTKIVQSNAENAEKLANFEFKDLIGRAAAAHGYKAEVLGDLVKARGLNIEMGETEVERKGANGQTEKARVQAAFVVKEDKSKVNLADFISTNLPDYATTLPAQAGTGAGGGKPWGSTGTKTNPGSSTGDQTDIGDFIKNMNDRRANQGKPVGAPGTGQVSQPAPPQAGVST